MNPNDNQNNSQPLIQPSPTSQPPFNQTLATSPVQQSNATNGSKGLAITALVLGIVGILTSGIGIGILLGLIGIILGIVNTAKHRAGKGLAIAGIITGAIAFLFGGFVFLMILIAIPNLQENARKTQQQNEQMQQLQQQEESNSTTNQ